MTRCVFPTSPNEALASSSSASEFRAGGTDFQERRELGRTRANIVDLRDVKQLSTTHPTDTGGLALGAGVTIDHIHRTLSDTYPALALAAGALATPQIRNRATLGGGLLQSSRCWYYRSARFQCHKTGVDHCPAREGDHLYHACFDRGPCSAPHPSTLAMALLTYDATAHVLSTPNAPTRALSMSALLGDGSTARTHTLEPHELLCAIHLPAPLPGERAGYFRATSRAHSEWPLVEVSVRLQLTEDGLIQLARVAIGGVAPVPFRLLQVESQLLGASATEETFELAGQVAAYDANPLPMTAYKVELIPGTVLETLLRALNGEAP